ncbi:Phosphatidylglycerol/phosphatidylinositol transfer protein [Oopsacas minuta]|uniref:Phosphatidylglycerol/phosphatidylinositol transfer protein n=1 Tax=Oopsacas minuta TaxID=111878 RepID=A0AAV7K8A2_9METZ|nr:Phosphatidylglycerol/phosphatidylinositol transfer protein [Oopsacas minuta]
MKGSLFVLLLSVWVVLSMGKVSVIEYDVEILPAISLNAAIPVNVNEVGDIWTNCGKAGDGVEIISVKITPDPPKKGQNVTIVASVNVKEEITGGKVNAGIKWGIIHLNKSFDLCELVKKAGESCPIAAGKQIKTLTQVVPNNTPGGHYTGKITVQDQNGKELGCIGIDLHL